MNLISQMRGSMTILLCYCLDLSTLLKFSSYKLHLERSSHPFKVFCIWVGSRGECTHTRTWAFMLRMSNACTCSAGKFTSIHFTGTPRGSAADPGPPPHAA